MAPPSLDAQLRASCSMAEWDRLVAAEAARSPGHAPPLRLSAHQADGSTVESDLRLPLPAAGEDARTRVRYAAARLNNLAMTRGAVAFTIAHHDARFAQLVVEEVRARFPQVTEVLEAFHARGIELRIAPGPGGPALRSRVRKRTGGRLAPRRVLLGPAIGINIGQSWIKVATVDRGRPAAGLRTVLPTWEGAPGHGFPALRARVMGLLESHLEPFAPRARPPAIGLALGGIVRGGRIVMRSGIAAGLSDADFTGLCDLAVEIARRTGARVAVLQDVIAKAEALRRLLPLRRALVLDLGTSTGGAYIDDRGRIPDWLGQVGRVVIDPSDGAVPRPDGGARGVLSQYLSVTGCMRLAHEAGLACERPEDLERRWIEAVPVARAVVGRFVAVLLDALAVLGSCYDLETVVLSGSMVRGAFGTELWSRARAGVGRGGPDVVASPEPAFDAAIGAAWAALEAPSASTEEHGRPEPRSRRRTAAGAAQPTQR